MKKYRTLAKLSMQNAIAYRGSFFINMFGSLFFVMSMFYLWKAIYQGQSQLGGFSWEQMKTYLFISFVCNSLLSYYSEGRIGGRIRSGEVAIDLLKPMDFQRARFSETIGISLFEGGISVVMMMIMAVFFSGILLPSDGVTWVLFLISMAVSVVIKFGIVYLFALCCFWTDSVYGISLARAAVTNLLSGALVPFTFLPEWMQTLCKVLPFQGVVYVPTTLFLEQSQEWAALQMIGSQVLWAAILWILGRFLYGKAVRQVTIYGG